MRHACIQHESIHVAIAVVLAVSMHSAISQRVFRLCLHGMLMTADWKDEHCIAYLDIWLAVTRMEQLREAT